MNIAEVDTARNFIDKARAAQTERGIAVRGRHFLSQDQINSIDLAVGKISFTDQFNNASGHNAVTYLLVRFEELCRRNRFAYPEEHREQISAVLVKELFNNVNTFTKAPAEKTINAYISLTLYHGDSFCSVFEEKEFASLRDRSYLYNYAATEYPLAPRKRLREVISTIKELKEDKEFESLRSTAHTPKSGKKTTRTYTPSYPFEIAAVHHPSDPRGFLRGVLSTIDELKKDEEFISLRNKPYHYRTAAIFHPTKPRKYLRKVISDNKALKDDEDKNLPEAPEHS